MAYCAKLLDFLIVKNYMVAKETVLFVILLSACEGVMFHMAKPFFVCVF